MILWITGPPGSRKTTVGHMLASETDRHFVDLDEMVARSSGMSVADIIRRQGEEEFRRHETACLSSIVEHPEHRRGSVVATGGGTILSHHNRDLMRSSGLRIHLDVDPGTILDRIAGSGDRPLLGDSPEVDDVDRLLRRREIPYADHDLAIDGRRSPERIVREIRARLGTLQRPAWLLNRSVGKERTQISVYESPWGGLQRAARRTRGARVCVLTDENVAVYYSHTLRTIAGSDGIVYIVEPGEANKSFVVVERIVERLAREGFSREDTILSFGGGMVTDLGGFVGSIYMRGIRTVSMPTSLLAMVDASVGGKTAINAAGLRNLVGTFRQPDEVIIVPPFLRTLPEREFRSGLVESMKMGITGSDSLRSSARRVGASFQLGILSKETTELIRLSVEEKLGIIAADAEDRERRRILNFGHTVAHALEGICPGAWTHGEAVALGIVAETDVALLGGVAPVDPERGEQIIADILPYTVPHPVGQPSIDGVLQAMDGDKKRGQGGIRMVVPSGDRSWMLDRVVGGSEVARALDTAWHRIEQYHSHRTGRDAGGDRT